MAKPNPSTKSFLGRARGLGASRSGVSHWWSQRITAIALLPLVAYAVFGFVSVADSDQAIARAWLAQPINTIAMLLLLLVGFYHASLGLQTIIEDYIANETRRILILALVQISIWLAATAGVYSVLNIALTTPRIIQGVGG
ncbi:MAG: succinate dehydrogenase, hydrophobic membrane anchor protein [Proteobacteria bacterium]|nr:succinate dehydrogenase, hydrophobic membrane anchor protein [Pseudomonadota bacterium]